jgi:heptosyltransferase-2
MQYLIYLCYRTLVAAVEALPLGMAYGLGRMLGVIGYFVFRPYRALAIRNLTIAYAAECTPQQIRRLAWEHFLTLGANLLSSIKAAKLNQDQLHKAARVENIEIIRAALDRGKGVVLVISHIGNWELFAQACQFLPDYRWGTIYQPLGNRYIEAHIRRTRMARGVQLFSRKNGFHAPTAFLRAGGAMGVLVDQHAGDSGVWTPFFGRLASTSTLAALLALRTEAELVPMAVHTDGWGKWRIVVSPPIPRAAPGDGPEPISALTARINQVLETQVRAAPADWFWVHNRWKTPKPKFLLATYHRGVRLPPDMDAAELKPFRILVRGANWLGDAAMTIPAVQAIARGRPDARVCVLAPAHLADLWRVVPGVSEVLPIEKGQGVFGVGRTIRRAGPFDAALVLPNSLRSALEVYLGKVPRRVGYAGHRRRWLLNQVVNEPPDTSKPAAADGSRSHQSLRYAHLAQAIGAVEVSLYGEGPSEKAVPWGRPAEGDAPGGWIDLALCPGAEYGPTKRWLPERFAEAAKRVAGEQPVRWVLVGVAKDQPYGEIIEKELGERCENLIGKTTLMELMTTLRRCRLLLTNDTGTMHLAAWLGVPTAAIFGSTDPILTGPLAPPERVRILRHQVECSPCFLRECPLDLRCMKAVTAEEVAAATLALIATSSVLKR